MKMNGLERFAIPYHLVPEGMICKRSRRLREHPLVEKHLVKVCFHEWEYEE